MTPVSVTWWGHATVTLELGGVKVLTDPVLHLRLAHLLRPAASVPSPRVVDAELVVVSHLHNDHCHVRSLRALADGTRLVGPIGIGRVLPASLTRRIELSEVRPGEVVRHRDLQIVVTQARHDPRRYPGSRIASVALGFVFGYAGARVWHPGDTGSFDEMTALAPIDIALVPVGGWGPSLAEDEHLDPVRAAEAVRRAGAAYAVPIHYGTYWPAGMHRLRRLRHQHWYQSPPRRFRDAVTGDTQVRVLGYGETTRWPDAE